VRIVHVITGLGVGGAETMLAKLLETERLRQPGRTVEVICLGRAGPLADRITATGIPLSCIGMGPGGERSPVSGFRMLLARLRATSPDVVQCWMYHADLLGGLASLIAVPRAARIWSIRASSMPYPSSLLTRAVIRTCALLSWIVPHRIISCSTAAAALHEGIGYRASRIVVIPNGFDLTRFEPDPIARASVRAELALDDRAPIIGCVARFDPQKDFPTLFRAYARVAERNASAVLVLVGRGCGPENSSVREMIAPALRLRVHLLGVRADIPRLTAAFDVALLTSAYGEGFPNVLGEALACGVPCVATDVGDSREIVGDEGFTAGIGDAPAIADGILSVLARPEHERVLASERSRARAMHDYDLDAIAARYWSAQDDVVDRRVGPQAQTNAAGAG
jgi:glycosyltransferase involved in cell wall biosynthesis